MKETMKIVILDSYSANPGDLSWQELEALGTVTAYERTKPEETVARAADAEIILTNKVVISREVMISNRAEPAAAKKGVSNSACSLTRR